MYIHRMDNLHDFYITIASEVHNKKYPLFESARSGWFLISTGLGGGYGVFCELHVHASSIDIVIYFPIKAQKLKNYFTNL